jgi:hypothetical protein
VTEMRNPRAKSGSRVRAVVLGAALTLTGCIGPLGRVGLEPDVVHMLTRDTAAWCVTVELANLVLGVTVVRVTYWRDNAPERGMSDMRHCTPWDIVP